MGLDIRLHQRLDLSLKLAPQNPEVQLNLGMNLEAHGRVDEARQAYASTIKLKPRKPYRSRQRKVCDCAIANIP